MTLALLPHCQTTSETLCIIFKADQTRDPLALSDRLVLHDCTLFDLLSLCQRDPY